ncbi:MAG: SRPBCC family protein [Gaiellaceae bacterium MAG52_C11]|nr:SRPBCC family protein [Candidatus Gaiellasilicea maunaloa]
MRIEASRTLPVDREVGFDYITDPKNWPHFWPDLVDIPGLGRLSWQEPGDTMRLRMRLAGRAIDLDMTLEELRRPALVRYRTAQQGMPDTAHERYFEPAATGFEYRLVVSFMPRSGLAGLFDRTLLRYATARALRRTLDNLVRQLPAPALRA